MRWITSTLATALFASIAPTCAQPAIAQLPPLAPQESERVRIIADGGFEQPDPSAWSFSDWPPRPETSAQLIARSVFYSQDRVRSGEWALGIDLTTVGEDRHLLAQQSFGVDKLRDHDGKRIRMSAWVWVESGPPGYQGGLSYRQWGAPGAAPIGYASVALDGVKGKWVRSATEFTLRVGETRRGDITVGAGQVADLTTSPVIYVDDVTLEVLGGPPLSARLLRGQTLLTPDQLLPIKVDASDATWADGLRRLRWNVTAPDGLRSYAEGDLLLTSAHSAIEVPIPQLPAGLYAVRLALGAAEGERKHEVLLPFRRAEGPFAR